LSDRSPETLNKLNTRTPVNLIKLIYPILFTPGLIAGVLFFTISFLFKDISHQLSGKNFKRLKPVYTFEKKCK
jgi:hypothetical protein